MSVAPRVRIAPAPSGYLHVGSVRTALYNWLHARRQGGTFVVRIEDTDAERATTASMESMLDAMGWIGLDWDEGPRVGGPYGPYRQSERGELHRAVARLLERSGALYRDARTPAELDAWRTARRAADLPPIVKHDEAELPESDDRPYALRLRTPTTGEVRIDDLVRGEVSWSWENLSDPILVRSDGTPTYLLANTCDDLAHGMTLICRGEDLLSATPVQVLLYELLTRDGTIDEALAEVGFPARDPTWTHPGAFAHLSLIMGPDGAKLSKRHGAVAIQEFARRGYLPEVLLNYLALLGWSSRDGRERFALDELVERFSFEQVGASAARFDVDKLTAFNGDRIRELSEDELAARLLPYLDGTHPPLDDETPEVDPAYRPLLDRPPSDEQRTTVRRLVPLVQERMQRLDEIQRYAPAFLRDDIELDPGSVAKVFGKPQAPAALARAVDVLDEVAWEAAAIEEVLRGLAEELGIGFGKLAQPIRVAVTGSSVSPPLFESLEILPRERVLERLRTAIPVAEAAQT